MMLMFDATAYVAAMLAPRFIAAVDLRRYSLMAATPYYATMSVTTIHAFTFTTQYRRLYHTYWLRVTTRNTQRLRHAATLFFAAISAVYARAWRCLRPAFDA